MKRHTKILIMISSALILCGICLSAVGLALGGATSVYFNGLKPTVDNARYTNGETLSVGDDTDHLTVDLSAAELRVVGVHGNSYIKYSLRHKPNIFQSAGHTYFKCRPAGINFGINFGLGEKEYVEIGISTDREYESINLNCDLGNISVYNLRCKRLNVTANAGNVSLNSIAASSLLEADLDLGSLTGEYITAGGTVARSNAGNITFDKFTSGGTDITNDLGNVSLSGSLNQKNIIKCNMGNCSLNLDRPVSSYKNNFEIDLGTYTLNGKQCKDYQNPGSDDLTLNISVDCGNLEITEP